MLIDAKYTGLPRHLDQNAMSCYVCLPVTAKPSPKTPPATPLKK